MVFSSIFSRTNSSNVWHTFSNIQNKGSQTLPISHWTHSIVSVFMLTDPNLWTGMVLILSMCAGWSRTWLLGCILCSFIYSLTHMTKSSEISFFHDPECQQYKILFLHSVLTEGQSDQNYTETANTYNNNLLFVHITVFMSFDNFQLVLLITVLFFFFFFSFWVC